MSFPFNKLMWYAAAASLAVALSGCGGGGGGSSIPSTTMMPGDGGTTMMPGDGSSMVPGSCEIGATLSAGQSCSHESTGNRFTFTVRDDGTGCVGGVCSGGGIQINNFSARKNTNGQWEILALPGEGAMMGNGGDTTMMPGDGDTTMMPGDGDTTMMPGDGDTAMMPGDGDTTMMPGDGDTTMMPGDGDTTMMPGDGDTPMTLSVSVFEGAVNADPVIAANVIAAIGKAAQARPLPGSVTQSSNVDSGGITTDTVEITTQYGSTGPSFWVSDGRNTYEAEWWIDMDMGEGNPRPIVDLSPPWKGVHLSKYLNSYSYREGGTLYVDVNSDIEAPSTQTVPGVPQDVQTGDQIVGLSCLGSSCSAATMQGTLNDVQGTFTCPGSCSIQLGGLFLSSGSGSIDLTGTTINGLTFGVDTFDVASAMGIVFTSESTTQTVVDVDYLSLGTWLFVPDDVARAAHYVFAAFTDGGDHFLQSNIMALQSTASYEGNAIGVYTEMTPEGTNIGDFNGEVRLTANFGGTSDLGTISGSITNFEVDGEREDGMLTLGTAPIGSQNSGFFKGQVSGSDVEHTYVGNWGGQFFGNSESDGKPGSAAGTFGGHSTDDAVNFVGAFGAHKQ